MNPSTSSPITEDKAQPATVILDACVLLNLHASGIVSEILTALPFRCLVASPVRREALWYLAPSEGDQKRFERHDVVLDPLIAAGHLEVVDLSAEEEVRFVELAQHLGDGEAASGALAIGRSASVATDDLKAIHLFRRLTPPLATLETGTLLRCWEERSGTEPDTAAAALQAIQRGARFSPRREADGAAWWRERMREISRQ